MRQNYGDSDFKSLEDRAKESREAFQVLQQPNAAYDEIQRLQSELTAARDEAERLRERGAELECMVKVFRGCIETGLHPNKNSPCHAKVIDLVGQQADELGSER